LAKLDILLPKLDITAGWELDIIDNQSALKGELNFGANLLMGTEFTVDLLSVASHHPVIELIVTTLDLVLQRMNGELIMQIKVYGKLSVNIKALAFNTLTGLTEPEPVTEEEKKSISEEIYEVKIRN